MDYKSNSESAALDKNGAVDHSLGAIDAALYPSASEKVDPDGADRSPSPPLGESIRDNIRELCAIDRTLVFYKLFYMFFCGAIGCVLPYVAVFLKQVGLGPEKIGIISGIRPIIGFVSAPLLGMYGDRHGKRRCILLISIVAWLMFYVALYHVPAPTRKPACPNNMVPHRSHSHKQRRAAEPATAAAERDLKAPDLPKDTQELLQENLEWLYMPGSLTVVFVTTFCLIVGGEVFQSPTTAMSDAGTLQTLGSERLHEYGYQRAWGSIGWGLSSFLAGALVSSSRRKEVLCGVELYFSDYRLLTYVFIGFLVIAFIAATQIKFKEGDDEEKLELTDADGKPQKIKPPSSEEGHKDPEQSHNAKAVLRVFLNVHYMSWLATSFFVGVCNGVIWGFLYWHLDNLGADQLLMGVSGIVVCVSEFIMFFLVGKVIKLIGHIGIMYVGLVGYAVRFCIYATISNPWWVLPAEVLQGITFSIVWVSMTAYTALAVPSASLATIQGILHGVYFGLGSGSGHLIGGLMIGYVGAVITFFTFAGASIFVLIIFAIAQKCSVKPLDAYGYKDLDEDADTVTGSREPPDTGTGGTGPSPSHHTATDGAPGPTDAGLSDTPSGDKQQY